MNANELADELDSARFDNALHLCDKAANMLRQQADRIAELEYLNNEHREVIKILMDEREALRDRIAELEKLVHQRFDDGKRLGVLETEDRFRLATPQTKPTTTLMESKAKIFWDEVNKTPQTKPLSDEEIEDIESRVYVKTISKGKPMGVYAKTLCRAIEERHGIK